jgi:hypothetical protein
VRGEARQRRDVQAVPAGVRRTKSWRIVTLVGFGTRRDRKRPLNDGQIPNPNGVRVASGAGYHRVEGNRRASRNGPVSDISHPNVTNSRLLRRCTGAGQAAGAAGAGRLGRGIHAARAGTSQQQNSCTLEA